MVEHSACEMTSSVHESGYLDCKVARPHTLKCMYERGVTYIQQHVTLEAGILEIPPSYETPSP